MKMKHRIKTILYFWNVGSTVVRIKFGYACAVKSVYNIQKLTQRNRWLVVFVIDLLAVYSEMPFGKKVECSKCNGTESLLWYKEDDQTLCNECYDRCYAVKVSEQEEKPSTSQEATKTVRKSTRITRNYRTRQNPDALPKQASQKGKGRRSLFKKTVRRVFACNEVTGYNLYYYVP